MKKHFVTLSTLLCLLTLLASNTAFAKSKKKKKNPEPPPVEQQAPAAEPQQVQAPLPSTIPPNTTQTTRTTVVTTQTVVYESSAQTGKGVDFVKQPMRFGAGLTIGIASWPISAKLFLKENLSVELSGPLFGVGVGTSISFGMVGDALYEGKAFYRSGPFDLSWQAGGGIDYFYQPSSSIYTNAYSTFGFHLNGGIQMIFTEAPIDIVWSYRPGFYFMTPVGKKPDSSNNAAVNTTVTNSSAGSTIFWPYFYGVALSARYYF